MASFAIIGISAAVNALAFSGTIFLFSKLSDHGQEERKRANRARERLENLNKSFIRKYSKN